MSLLEPLPELFTRSKLMILDFSQIPEDAPEAENIQKFFQDCEAKGINPRLPQNRQQFNNHMLDATGMRYLVSRYGEDRSAMLAGSQIAKEGRTLHLGIDVFSRDQETVYAPCDGEIVLVGQEPEDHSYGYYLIMRADDITDAYIFFGHLSPDQPKLGRVKAGQPIAKLGDYKNHENGGWSRHLHIQMFSALPGNNEGLVGYATKDSFPQARQKYPDPMPYFPDWRLR